jgi:hypothetical protein
MAWEADGAAWAVDVLMLCPFGWMAARSDALHRDFYNFHYESNTGW